MKSLLALSLVTVAGLLTSAALALAEKHPQLPPPFATPSISHSSTTIGWPRGQAPVAAPGFEVTLLAELPSPRSMLLLPDGDVLVSQAEKHPADNGVKSPNRITRLKLDGSRLVGTELFASGLDLPFGMALWQNEFFVAEPTRVLKYRYEGGRLAGSPVTIATFPFPQPQHHWTRHLLLSPDGSKLYVSVGSASNVGEAPDPLDRRNAAILELDRSGRGLTILAGGLRNPVSMAWEPVTGDLWTVVNERDELGDELVPDYITHVVRGGFYGWPYSYWGSHEDPRQKGVRRDLQERAIAPDFSVGSHVAALGITFTHGTSLPAPFSEGALVAEHGSWNSSHLVGYKVSYVPFVNGQAEDGERDFLTGFIASDAAGTVYGRPVATVVLKDGSVLVSDDAGGKIWIVRAKANPQ